MRVNRRVEPGMALGRVERTRSVVAIRRRMRHRTRRREVVPPHAVVDLWPNTVEVSAQAIPPWLAREISLTTFSNHQF